MCNILVCQMPGCLENGYLHFFKGLCRNIHQPIRVLSEVGARLRPWCDHHYIWINDAVQRNDWESKGLVIPVYHGIPIETRGRFKTLGYMDCYKDEMAFRWCRNPNWD